MTAEPVAPDAAASAEAPLTTLRGAGVDVDVRRVAGAVGALLLLGLAVLVVVLFVAGMKKNSEISQLRDQGVPVNITVTSCLGLMGGSGSNLAGYQCNGTFVLEGHRYTEPIPGNTFHARGATLASVSVPGDPGLVSTVSDLRNEHTSAGVFVLPAVLLVVLGLAVAGVLWRRRRLRSGVAA